MGLIAFSGLRIHSYVAVGPNAIYLYHFFSIAKAHAISYDFLTYFIFAMFIFAYALCMHPSCVQIQFLPNSIVNASRLG